MNVVRRLAILKMANGSLEPEEVELSSAQKNKVHALLKAYKGKAVPDEHMHTLAENMGVEVDDLESYVYGLASKYLSKRAEEVIPGGKAEGKSPSDFNPKALAKGTKVEMEHTKDRALAREIAMDHLAEDPKYYDKLPLIESH